MDVGFNRVRASDRLVHPGSLGSLGFALGVVGFSRISPGGRRLVHLRSLDSLRFVLGVVGFIWVRWVR